MNTNNSSNWPQLIRKSFDFKNGQGVAQLNLRHLFASESCEEIYQNFTSNLNWIIRDNQKLKIPKRQVPMAEYLCEMMGFFRILLQQNIPEKDHVHLTLEALRIGRSDGTQHQVGSRIWHQDNEAYFTLLINLTENASLNNSTRFYHLEPGEKYDWASGDRTGSHPIIRKHWKESFIESFHLGIINSGVRYFLFPFSPCRPIIHRSPTLSKRLAIFANFSISGVEQGMDLRDIYAPLLGESESKTTSNALQDLRNHWRNILGIEESIHTKNSFRRSEFEHGLYKINSINYAVFNKRVDKQEGTYDQYRIVNFGLRQFKNKRSPENKKLLNEAIPIGELSMALYYFSQIGNFSIRKISMANNSPLLLSDCSLLGNNNYDLLVQFKQPSKAFQLLSMKEVLSHIDQFALILYQGAQNYIYPESKCEHYWSSLPFEREKKIKTFSFTEKQLSKNKVAQIFTSFPLSQIKDLKESYFLSRAIEKSLERGAKSVVGEKNNTYFLINKNAINKKMHTSKQNLRAIDKVPFFLPRTGTCRTLQKVDLGSQLITLSKRILCAGSSK